VTIASNASANPSVSLSGTGLGSAVSWTPGSLTFPGQAVNTTSSAQALTLSKTEDRRVTNTSIATRRPFAQNNNCGASLAAGANCTVNVTFTPPSVGSQSGNVTIASNASANPSVSLSGTGLGSVVSWTPGSLTFPGQAVNTISSAQALTLS